MEDSVFNKHLDHWIGALTNNIEKDLSSGKKVYIIALSRKMPRTFNWVKKHAQTGLSQNLAKLLEKPEVVLTTEYALPLLTPTEYNATDSDYYHRAFYIVDDAIIFGATANRVGIQTMALTGMIPKVSMVFRSKVGSLGLQFESEYSLLMNRLDETELIAAIRGISDKIHQSSLPVDMEYPIIYVKRPYSEVKAFIERSAPHEWIRYSVKSHVGEIERDSFTIILGDESNDNYNNDFAKIRLFPKDQDGCQLEIIAPNAVGLAELENIQYFENPSYAQVWQTIIKRIDSASSIDYNEGEGMRDVLKGFKHRANSLTKVAWLNYLLSLSVFNRHIRQILPKEEKISIDKADLILLLGDEITKETYDLLDQILQNEIWSKSEHQRVALPKFVNPEELSHEYRLVIANAIDPDNTVEENLDAIFNISHFSKPIFKNIVTRDIVGHHCFGETFESLKSHLSLYHYNDAQLEEKINRWIDARINECKISPKYEIVTGSDLKSYYRRFFLSGSNPI